MKKIQFNKMLLLAVVGFSVFQSCKKDKTKKADTTTTVVTPTATRSDLTKDSIFLYAKEVYYWSDALPSYEIFNPRKYTAGSTDLINYNTELFDITQLKINPTTSKPYEYSGTPGKPKYSYIADKTNKNPIAVVANELSSVDLEGNGNDFGIKSGAYGSTNAYSLYLQAVYQNSPADKAGLKRGDIINKINGTSIGSNYTTEVNFLNDALFTQTTVTLEGIKSNGSAFNIPLVKTVYKSSPIYKSRVIDSLGKKIGYLSYARFSNATNSEAALLQVFADFAAASVTDLIIDLRYNGGGYVSTAEYLTNLIAPASLSGKTMYTEYYNALMQSGGAKILANQPLLDGNGKVRFSNGKMLNYYTNVDYSAANNTHNFSKVGSLNNITNVVFIVSGSTASASELVINSLKPHLNVKLVGSTTYGKPVGFFPVTLENRYDVYFSMFETKNSLGQGAYYSGMTVDSPVLPETPYDDASRDFGDPKENYIKKAVTYLGKNSFIASIPGKNTITIQGEKVSTSTVKELSVGNNDDFKGMIETRYKLK